MEEGVFFRNVVLAAIVIAVGSYLFIKDDLRQADINAQVSHIDEIYTLEAEQNQYLELLMASGNPKLLEFAKNWKDESKDMNAKYRRDVLKAFVQKNLPNAIPDNANVEVVDGSQK
ncbi:hypothetical protein [Aeromonas hydrophila]|uniref:hypothetical protein n=1 Tax=Aeromonas hydrophila TaxID=644 RepID=UPI002B47E57B|nr:hypothetical protein [Aeromonas hydrophila]